MILDLVVLAADKSTEEAVHGLLGRPQAIGIRPIVYTIVRHPHKDPGCYHRPEGFLLPYAGDTDHALVIFDRAWEGVPEAEPQELGRHVEERLRPAWGDRARTVVIDPELEIWVWSDSPNVDKVLGWTGHEPPLRVWLEERGYWPRNALKPPNPKRAYLEALEEVRQQKSSSNFRNLAGTVGLSRCGDPSFTRLREILQEWFGRV
ncbi:MAG: hypothetical protein JXQ29_13845 [Planctomycetes bacterium]|nr:hypothetical protein [Planctomycetota bacterium]